VAGVGEEPQTGGGGGGIRLLGILVDIRSGKVLTQVRPMAIGKGSERWKRTAGEWKN